MPVALRLLLALTLAAVAAGAPRPVARSGYAAMLPAGDTARPSPVAVARAGLAVPAALPLGAEIEGFLSSRGLPPRPGRFVVTATGLVFHSGDRSLVQTYPLIGPVRVRDGRYSRDRVISLVYRDTTVGQEMYVFRMDGGVFGTHAPGPLLELSEQPSWLDSLASPEWEPDRPLVGLRDTARAHLVKRRLEGSTYADTLYALFGRPARPMGLVGRRGRSAGRLGEYIASRDSVALDPARMTSREQLRHTLAHELAHRWQAYAPGQLRTLWQDVPVIPDTRRYGHRSPQEHQAEAVAFAVHFLQATASPAATAGVSLLEHYELLVPGTVAMARYLALQPVYQSHPLRRVLIGGERS